MHGFNILNVTERLWKGKSWAFNNLPFCFLKEPQFLSTTCPEIHSLQAGTCTSATFYAQIYLFGNTIATFGPVQIK